MKGSTTQRGYDARHKRRRELWRPYVEAGRVDCARCGERIEVGSKWDLGHDDNDRRLPTYPEHHRCNRATHTAARRADPMPQPRTHW